MFMRDEVCEKHRAQDRAGLENEIAVRLQIQEVYRTLLDDSPLGMLIIQQGRVVFANPNAVNMAGTSSEALTAMSPEALRGWVHPDDREEFERCVHCADTSSGRYSAELRITGKDGKAVWVEVLAVATRFHDGPAAQICLHDITARKAAEAKLEKRLRYETGIADCSRALLSDSEDALSRALDALLAAAGVSRICMAENVRDDNGALCFRMREGGCVPVLEAESGETAVQCLYPGRWQTLLEQGREVAGTIDGLSPEERRLLEAEGVTSILLLPVEAAGQWNGFLAFNDTGKRRVWQEDDIRILRTAAEMIGSWLSRRRAEEERRQLDLRIQQSQKMESLGMLAGGIAHDFNNILMGVMGNADLALMNLSADHQARKNVRMIAKAAKRAADLARQMLMYTGCGRFEAEMIDIPELIRGMQDLIAAQPAASAQLALRLGDELPLIEGDAAQIRQVILNIVTNAAEALPEGNGFITIAAACGDYSLEALRSPWAADDLEAGRYVCIEISDTGSGMDEVVLNRIFDPFYSTRFIGRGLGLAVVLGIMRAHHGAIHVRSAPGRGSTFSLLFPAAGIEKNESIPEKCPAAEKLSGNILLVDDDADLRDTVREMLERFGCSVLTAESGDKAAAIFKRHQKAIDAVILDLTMPQMDGLETCDAIQTLHPDTPVILSSGYDEAEVLRKCRGHSLAGFLHKPYSPEALYGILEKALAD
jgi:PAS domain S-box-containing protein